MLILILHLVTTVFRLFREGATYVAHVPELDISSCGETQEKARANIEAAVRGFLETAEAKGTLMEILEQAGYKRVGSEWKAPEFISLYRMTVTF